MSNWTQAVCRKCWDERNPNREPAIMLLPLADVCCYCAAVTRDGIFVRVDPSTVPYPSEER